MTTAFLNSSQNWVMEVFQTFWFVSWKRFWIWSLFFVLRLGLLFSKVLNIICSDYLQQKGMAELGQETQWAVPFDRISQSVYFGTLKMHEKIILQSQDERARLVEKCYFWKHCSLFLDIGAHHLEITSGPHCFIILFFRSYTALAWKHTIRLLSCHVLHALRFFLGFQAWNTSAPRVGDSKSMKQTFIWKPLEAKSGIQKISPIRR